ncbi:hypothetical protein M3Y94_00208900 [Aphelenchoides besseyi]|nr:hypothetical protein M3Y94_00208900 [Aphelenchoides besseyi]KAI6236642.1 hypothetical protein M3Y95_00179300 [Aphelenchoides besseyi]
MMHVILHPMGCRNKLTAVFFLFLFAIVIEHVEAQYGNGFMRSSPFARPPMEASPFSANSRNMNLMAFSQFGVPLMPSLNSRPPVPESPLFSNGFGMPPPFQRQSMNEGPIVPMGSMDFSNALSSPPMLGALPPAFATLPFGNDANVPVAGRSPFQRISGVEANNDAENVSVEQKRSTN